MKILVEICRSHNILDILAQFMVQHFDFLKVRSEELLKKQFAPHLENLIDNLYFVVEAPFRDKVYADMYHKYYSTKNDPPPINCIKVSIFKKRLKQENFSNNTKLSKIKDSLMGFIIIRPLVSNIVGRYVISPNCLIYNNFRICRTRIPIDVHYVKMSVEGFPFSSQDGEITTCAETCLWACMEYSGYKHSEVSTILPSKINQILRRLTFERHLPSPGLENTQISGFFKKLGFGSKIYQKDEFSETFKELFCIYVESGIPFFVGLSDPNHNTTVVGHAMLCIGRTILDYPDWYDKNLNLIQEDYSDLNDTNRNLTNAKFISFYEQSRQFVFMDDNCPPYRLATFESPCHNYPDSTMSTFQIEYFVVPLHAEVYLEAFLARKFILHHLTITHPLPQNSENIVRIFLTSSRLYKNWLTLESNLPSNLKELILSRSLPKFIWIAEIGSRQSFSKKKAQATGLVILDAMNIDNFASRTVIFSAHSGVLRTFIFNEPKKTEVHISSFSFDIYLNNLTKDTNSKHKKLTHENRKRPLSTNNG